MCPQLFEGIRFADQGPGDRSQGAGNRRQETGGSNKSFHAITVASPQAFRRAEGPIYTSLG